jgi:kynurenine 3-monooxygenase
MYRRLPFLYRGVTRRSSAPELIPQFHLSYPPSGKTRIIIPMVRKQPILIVGAGLAGCLMALELAQLGYRVVVYEKRPADGDPLAPRRSINLALAPATLQLLTASARLGNKLKSIATPLRGRVFHPIAGKPVFEPYARTESEATLLNPVAGAVSVSRAELNGALRSAAAEHSNVEFRFGQKVVGCDPNQAALEIADSRQRTFRVEGEIVIGADGANSAIRGSMTLNGSCPAREDRATLQQGYKELALARTSARGMRKCALHIWPRSGFLLMALPNCDGTFQGGIFLRQEGQQAFSNLKSDAAVRDFFEENFKDVAPYIVDLEGQFARNPVNSVDAVQCDPWSMGRTILIGDACHTLYPFSGHGANLALNDCLHLRQCIERHAPDWQRAFSLFTDLRKPKIDSLCSADRVVSALVLNALPQNGIQGFV